MWRVIPSLPAESPNVVAWVGVGLGWKETAGPSTTLRSGRDDKNAASWRNLLFLEFAAGPV